MSKDNPLAKRFRKLAGEARDAQTLCEQACRVVVDEGQLRMAWVGRLDTHTNRVDPITVWGYDEGYVEQSRIALDRTKQSIGPTGTALRERRMVVNNDFRTSLTGLPWRDEALKRGYLSSAAFPVIVGNRAWGTLNAYASMPNLFDDARVTMLAELASELAAALTGLVEPEADEPEPNPPT